MTARTRWIFFAAAATFWLLLLLGAYPFFAITAPVKAEVLVVEGWLKPYQLDSVRALVQREHYRRVYTTGVVRPCSYHLKAGEAVEAVLRKPVSGSGRAEVAGLPGERLVITLDRDTVLDAELTGHLASHAFHVQGDASVVRISVGTDPGAGPMDVDRAFLGRLTFEQGEFHQLVRDLWTVKADGTAIRVGTTWAHTAALTLVQLGLPDSMVVPKPTYGDPARYTWTTAKQFVDFARNEGITAFNVASLGVHARRTRGLYRRAAQGAIDIGVYSVYDTWCRRSDWFLHWYGWWKVVKEIVGAHQPYTL